MKRNNENRILLYLSGQMTESERREFEAQLKESASLREELDKNLKILNNVKDLGNVRINEQYFTNLMPRVRQRLESKKRLRLYPKLAYILPILAIIAVLITKPFSSNNNSNIVNQNAVDTELGNVVAGMDDNTKAEILNSLAESEDVTNPQPVHITEAADNEALENKMTNEIFKTDEAKVNFLSNEDIQNNLSQEETQKIYKALLNKKIL